MIIALTGNIGSGKSTACKIFRKYGYKVINADSIGHELYKKNEVMRIVIRVFGEDIISNGEIDRRKLKDIVFYDSFKLKKLNAIMHPLIIEKIKDETTNKCVIEGALVFEAEFTDYDIAIVISVNKEEQKKRLLAKGKYNEEEINNIIKSQMNQEEKIQKADYVIDNSGSLKEFEKNIEKVINRI